MAVSFSRPDPSSPAAVASASFATVRRGFDADEVRDFLRMVAAELSRLQERERYLERELQNAHRRPAAGDVELDEETVTALLGEETARVLSTAREAAGQIRGRAEEGASRLLRDAQDEAARVREEAELEIARRRHDAAQDAEAEVELARQQGRDMVNEARSYRERVLADLGKRRDAAREQLQLLASGRERLVQAFERARLVTADVLGEITELADESDDTMSFGPITGPVPLTSPERSAPAEPSQSPGADAASEASASEASGDVVVEPAPELHVIQAEDDVELVVVVSPPSEPLAPVVALFAGEIDTAEIGTARIDTTEIDTGEIEITEIELAVAEIEIAEIELAEEGAQDGPLVVKPSVDDLFARLKASRADVIARDALAAAERAEAADESNGDAEAAPAEADADVQLDITGPILSELDVSPFVRRDEELAPHEVTLSRRLKRVLADEQSDLLDVLRGRDPVRSIDALLPLEAAHVAAYVGAAVDDLAAAARLGATSLSQDPAELLARRITDADVVAKVSAAIAEDLVLPLRERVERAVADADGDHRELGNHLRSIYREWKTQRLDDHALALLNAAYARGAASSIVPGTAVYWMADPTAAPCTDADSNCRAGAVRFGDAFPTGDRTPPSHIGCTCLLVEADR
ncbi:MAG: DivIVA domain-containing protein [Acidimicrobiia bacterium]